MPATYEPIATTTLSTAASTITFSSIPATYTDLRVVFVGQGTFTQSALLRFNNDTGTNYSTTQLQGDGGAVYSQRQTNNNNISMVQIPNNGGTANNTFGMVFFEIFSYAGSTNKTVLGGDAGDTNGSGNINRIVGLWRNTSAINEITITTGGASTYVAGTTATLYGIKAA